MNRKEINIFSTSFLDLLSGALGAVLILFIIIPKLTSVQQDALEEIERLNVQTEELADLIELARNSIPVDLYEQIQAQIEEIQRTMDELADQVEDLQRQLTDCESDNARFREELDRMRRELREAQQELERLRPPPPTPPSTQPPGDPAEAASEQIGILEAELAIAIIWLENVDVDLHVKNMANGVECYYGRRSTPFGNLLADITSRTPGDGVYEIFYQTRIVPGRYEVSINLYSGSSAVVDGYVVMLPGTINERKINFRQVHLAQNTTKRVRIGFLTVTENNINLEQ